MVEPKRTASMKQLWEFLAANQHLSRAEIERQLDEKWPDGFDFEFKLNPLLVVIISFTMGFVFYWALQTILKV